jgi:hypothetical protein
MSDNIFIIYRDQSGYNRRFIEWHPDGKSASAAVNRYIKEVNHLGVYDVTFSTIEVIKAKDT